jgi:hypothetical protein
MHSIDRHWPVMFVPVIVVLAMLLVAYIVLYGLTGESPQWMISRIDWLSWNTCLNVYIAVIGAIFGWGSILYGLRARRRERIRMRALAGDVSAMPVVSSSANLSLEATTDAMRDEPLTLHWSDKSVVTASQDGLRWQRPKKRDVVILWSEAHLLERWKPYHLFRREKPDPKAPEIIAYGYCLYGRGNAFIEWTDAPESQAAGERLSWERKQRLEEELLSIVTAHTRLPVRSMGSPISSQDTQGKQSRSLRGISLYGSILVQVIVLIPLVTGILALVAPLTRSLILNLSVAIVIGGVGLVLLVADVKGLIAVYRPHAPVPPPIVQLPLVPLVVTPDTTVAIRASLRLRDRLLNILLVAVGLASSVYLVVRALQDFPDTDFQHFSLTNLHALALNMFGLCAIIGIMFVAVGTFSRATIYSADVTGLHRGRGKKALSIPWHDVVILTATVLPPQKLESFDVIEAPPYSNEISWPADARWVRPPEGILADNAGAQFAAIVAARAGVQLTTQWE